MLMALWLRVDRFGLQSPNECGCPVEQVIQYMRVQKDRDIGNRRPSEKASE